MPRLFWVILIILGVLLIVLIDKRHLQTGGGREAIFSRFSYQPDFPMISQFDTVDLDRFSKVYNIAGPRKYIMGRPYRYYHTEDSTWLYPWDFPRPINYTCLKTAIKECHEPLITIKTEEDKLGGLGVETPRDIVHVSPCFNKEYDKCKGIQHPKLPLVSAELNIPLTQ
jgi:hypothetical protein